MSPVDPNNPFAFELEVEGEDNLRKALAKGERAYLNFGKSIDKVTDGLQDESEAHAKAGQAAKKAAQAAEEATEAKEQEAKKLGFFAKLKEKFLRRGEKADENAAKRRGGVSKRIRGFFKREKDAADDAGISFGKLAGLIGGATIIGGLVAAARAYLEFDNQIRQLQSTLAGQPRVMNAAASAVQGLTGYLEFSREELIAVTKQMGDLHLVAGNTPKAAQQFRELTMDVLHLSRAMDVGTSSVVDMFDSFKRVYGLPHHRLRGIASSMKFIQEQTGITGEELLTFGKSLEDVLARMRGTTKNTKADVTRDMMAMAGVMKKFGIDAGDAIPSLFSEAMKIDSDKGNEWLAFLQSQTGVAMEDIRSMIEKGDTVTPMTLFIKSLKQQGPEMLRLNESYFTDMTGMSFAHLRKLMDVNEKGLRGFVEQTKKAEKVRNLHEKRAQARQNQLSQMWNNLKRAFERIWLAIGKIVVKVTTKLADFLIPKIMQGISWLEQKFAWFNSPEGGKAIHEWWDKTIKFFSKAGGVIEWVVDKISKAIKWWQGLSTETKTLIGVGGGLVLVFGKLLPIMGALGGKVAAVAAGLTAVYVGAKKVADWVDKEQTKGIKALSKAKATSHAITEFGLKGTEQERMGFIKGEMFGKEAQAGRTLITGSGKINMDELNRRATALIPTPAGWDFMPDFMKRKTVLEPRQRLVKMWAAALGVVLKKTDMSKVRASRERDLARLKQTQKPPPVPVAKVAPAPTTTPQVRAAPTPTPVTPTPPVAPAKPPSGPQIVAVQSQTTDALLGEIRDILKKGSAGTAAGAQPHPSRAQFHRSLGG